MWYCILFFGYLNSDFYLHAALREGQSFSSVYMFIALGNHVTAVGFIEHKTLLNNWQFSASRISLAGSVHTTHTVLPVCVLSTPQKCNLA